MGASSKNPTFNKNLAEHARIRVRKQHPLHLNIEQLKNVKNLKVYIKNVANQTILQEPRGRIGLILIFLFPIGCSLLY